jgi:hypothetical protein
MNAASLLQINMMRAIDAIGAGLAQKVLKM